MQDLRREHDNALTLVLFGLPQGSERHQIAVAVKSLSIDVISAHINPKGNAGFVLFKDFKSLEAAWRAAKASRIVVNGRALRGVAKDAETEKLFLSLDEEYDEHQDYEDPSWGFLDICLQRGVQEKPYFRPLTAPTRACENVTFVRAWKSLLLEEYRAQIWDGAQRAEFPLDSREDARRWYRVQRWSQQKAPQNNKNKKMSKVPESKWLSLDIVVDEGNDQDMLMIYDAVLLYVGGKKFFGILDKDREDGVPAPSSSTVERFLLRLAQWDETIVDNTMGARVFLVASLLTGKRAYDALNWYHLADLSNNVVTRGMMLEEKVQRNGPDTRVPKAPQGLNETQGSVVTHFVNLEQGVTLCQGPPGTGKTTLTVKLLECIAGPKTRVMVCAPSNKAVHEILERFRAANPLFPVLFVGNKRKKLPPLVQQVYCDEFFVEKAKEVSEAASSGNFKMVSHVLSFLKMWGTSITSSSHFTVLQRQCERIAAGACWSCGDVNGNMVCSKCKAELNSWSRTSNAVKQVVATLSESHGEFFVTELLEKSRILFMTLSSSGRHIVRRVVENMGGVDILVVDEAAQASEPEMLIPLFSSPKKALLIGDPMQLPATVFSEIASQQGFGVSTMERLMKNAACPLFMLVEQYRMMADIRRWPSDVFYGSKIRDGPSVLQRVTPWMQGRSADDPLGGEFLPHGNRALVLCGGKEKRVGTTFSNPGEADFVTSFIPKLGVPLSSIGIVTFYLGQKDLLQKLVPPEIAVNTVDGFQGGEKDIIIVTCVRSQSITPFMCDPKRLNVCITRARFYLLVLCSLPESAVQGPDLLARFLKSFPSDQVMRAQDSGNVDALTDMIGSLGIESSSSNRKPIMIQQQQLKPVVVPVAAATPTITVAPPSKAPTKCDIVTFPSSFRQGDWICASCKRHNFRKSNTTCFSCKAPKKIHWQQYMHDMDIDSVVSYFAQNPSVGVDCLALVLVGRLFAECPASELFSNLDAKPKAVEREFLVRCKPLLKLIGKNTFGAALTEKKGHLTVIDRNLDLF